jgi:heme-degrading monooxygenase HmoA
MILEVATLNMKPGKELEFEETFHQAQKIISSMDGYVSHNLHKCIENSHRYILLVKWGKIEDHIEGFRKSKQYLEWSEMLHHFYDPFPIVEHYTCIEGND